MLFLIKILELLNPTRGTRGWVLHMRRDKRSITIVISNLLLIAVVVCAVAGFYLFYNLFTKGRQAEAGRKNPAIMIIGPSTANPGDFAVMYVKNVGSVDLANWTFTTGLEDSGGPLPMGGQCSFSAELTGTAPWTFTVQAQSERGDIVEDTWVIDRP